MMGGASPPAPAALCCLRLRYMYQAAPAMVRAAPTHTTGTTILAMLELPVEGGLGGCACCGGCSGGGVALP